MKIKGFIIIAGIFFGFVTCTDILDTAPYHQVGTANMWKTEALTDQGVNGIYANLRNWGIYGTGNGSGAASLSSGSPTMANGMGQWAYEVAGPLAQTHNGLDFLFGSLSTGSGTVNNVWRRLYEGVHRANNALANLPGAPVSDTKRARLIAEVKFLRAFHYFRLNELWRGVPYYDTPIEVQDCTKGQETEAFIWGKVLDDLNDCIGESNFPNNDFVDGRVTKGAAYALRGKVYMQLGQWQNAINDFQKVGDCGYGLWQGGYKELFTAANERCKEMIFSVQNIMLQGYGSCVQFYCGTRSHQGGGWGDHYITPYAVELYENADGTPFNWNDYLPGYTSLGPAERQIYFLRDKEDAVGNEYNTNPSLTTRVNDRLNAIDADGSKGVRALYLPHGNEARIRTAYDNRDPRLEANVITPCAKFRGVYLTAEFMYSLRFPFVGNATVTSLTAYMEADIQTDRPNEYLYLQRKFLTEGYNSDPLFSRERGEIDDPIIRYADILLMWAEALVELNQSAAAMEKVKEVRDRAGIVTLASNFADQTTARKYVRDERRREMLGEGGAYFDELRWGTLKETKYPEGASTKQINGVPGGGAAYRWPEMLAGDKFVWPIPRAEIERNPNLTRTPNWTY